MQVSDSKTSDVSRACFVSIDTEAYFNPNCTPVDINAYIDEADSDAIFKMKYEQEQHEKGCKKSENEQTPEAKDPDKEILECIRQKLNPKSSPKQRQSRLLFPNV